MLGCRVRGSGFFLRHDVLLLYQEALTQQQHVTLPEDLNLKVHWCKNLKSHSLHYLSHISIPMEMRAKIVSEPNNFGCCASLKHTFWGLNVWYFCVGGKCCPHIIKAVDLTGVKKALRAGGIMSDCTDCAKMPATNNGLPAGEEVGGIGYMLPSAYECWLVL